MRIWEVDESKAIPSNLVREQDFILRVRRMHRRGEPYRIINIALASIDSSHGGRGPLEEAQGRLQAFAVSSKSTYAEMSNGDVFLIWPDKEVPPDAISQILAVTLPSGSTAEDTMTYLHSYHLPDDYTILRERTNYYIDQSNDATMMGAENSPAQILQTEAARGPLTAWSADQIGRLIEDIDILRYVKKQSVYERQANGSWKSIFEEWYVSFDDLRQVHFPKMDVLPTDHLFREICQGLDKRLLHELSQNTDPFSKQNISLNLSIASLTGSAFASFAYTVLRAYHRNIIGEVNCGDFLQDFSLTLGSIAALRREGFRVAIDGVTPDMLPYLNVSQFKPDFIKLNVGQDHFDQLNDRATREALSIAPKDKLIFHHCDHESALVMGLSLGVTKFQGWHMDKMIKKKY